MYRPQGVRRREAGSVSAVWGGPPSRNEMSGWLLAYSCRSCWDLTRKHKRYSSVGSPTADLLLVGLSGGSGGQSRFRAALTRSCPPRPRRKDSPSFLGRHADSDPRWSGDPMPDGVNRAGDFGYPCTRLRKLTPGVGRALSSSTTRRDSAQGNGIRGSTTAAAAAYAFTGSGTVHGDEPASGGGCCTSAGFSYADADMGPERTPIAAMRVRPADLDLPLTRSAILNCHSRVTT